MFTPLLSGLKKDGVCLKRNAGRLESSSQPEGTAHAQKKVRLSHACAENLSKFDESRIFWRRKIKLPFHNVFPCKK